MNEIRHFCLKQSIKLLENLQACWSDGALVFAHSISSSLLAASILRLELCFGITNWICIACPFQGALGCINDSLLSGLQFVYGFESFFFVSRWAMHQLLVECPPINLLNAAKSKLQVEGKTNRSGLAKESYSL
ncbi:hypothetical protein ACQ4PT_058824 [Festuca glaucescens]